MKNQELDNYMKIQQLVQKEARDIAVQVYNELGSKYNVNSVPVHVHDGVGSVQIEEKNLIQNTKNLAGFDVDSSGTYIVRGLNLSNLRRIVLYGFAANNVSAPATKRAIINGEVQFGRCYEFSGGGTGTVTVTTNQIGTPFIQIYNSMYVDSTSLANNRVGTGGDALVRVSDNTGTDVAVLTIDSYTFDSITLTATLAAGWQINSTIIIT